MGCKAAVVERYAYDPYGSFTILNGEHDADADADGRRHRGWRGVAVFQFV
ncbi:MAG: hypothetical protein ACFCVE_13330 [Phycisphaerae bacterium]